MGSEKRYKKVRSRKRKGFATRALNANTSVVDTTVNNEPIQNKSASGKKLNVSFSESDPPIATPGCNFFINSDLFMSLINIVGRCPVCVAAIDIEHLLSNKMGLAQFFNISCTECNWKITFCSSKECSILQSISGRKSFEINLQAITAFREIGRGFSAIKTFCSCMNMPSPMAKTTFIEINSDLHNAYVQTAQESMKAASKQIHFNKTVDDSVVIDAKVSGDGAWQKRGYSSLNGVVTLISEGKCIDTEVLSKKCKQCEMWELKKMNVDAYNNWNNSHVCSINHVGSAGAMEVVGIKIIFSRSVRLHCLRYTFYIGDGDTKSFEEICKSDPYPGHIITKGECIGHVQKRVGTRLRKLKADYKGKKLTDGRSIGGGKGRLTNKVMNTLQNHVGMAIRQNSGNLYGMKKAVAAVLHHATDEPNLENRHQFCPRSSDSWCRYQSDKITGKKTYKEKISIHKAVSDVIAPIFSHRGLGSDELLTKCLHGETQNVNESLNNLIWTRCPKRVYIGNDVFKTAVASAVIAYNDGAQGLLPVFNKLGIEIGYFTKEGLRKSDIHRVKQSEKKSTSSVKQRRKKLLSIRKGHNDKNELEEGKTYACGAF
jgi:hypothetical protein